MPTREELALLAEYCPAHGQQGCDDHHYGATQATSHGSDGIDRPWGPTCSATRCYWSKEEGADEKRRIWSPPFNYREANQAKRRAEEALQQVPF